jgi:hypothetical protein
MVLHGCKTPVEEFRDRIVEKGTWKSSISLYKNKRFRAVFCKTLSLNFAADSVLYLCSLVLMSSPLPFTDFFAKKYSQNPLICVQFTWTYVDFNPRKRCWLTRWQIYTLLQNFATGKINAKPFPQKIKQLICEFRNMQKIKSVQITSFHFMQLCLHAQNVRSTVGWSVAVNGLWMIPDRDGWGGGGIYIYWPYIPAVLMKGGAPRLISIE